MINTSSVESPDDLNRRYADQFLPLIIYLAVHAVTGVMGNTVVLLVYSFSKEYRNTTFKVFVLYLAALDIMSCLTFIPTEIARLNNFYWDTDTTLCQLKCFFNVFYNTALALALFIIAIHRYRKVCQPFKSQISPSMGWKIALVSMVVSCVLSVPAPIMCGIQTSNKTNIYNTTTLVQICTTEPSISKIVVQVNVITISLLLFIVCVALIVMYVLISKALITQWRKMKTPEVNCRVMKHLRSSDTLQDSLGGKTDTCVVENTAHETKTEILRHDIQNPVSSGCSDTMKSNENIGKSCDKQIITGPRSKKPYKTLIWLFLTGIFIVTNVLYVMAAFNMSKEDKRSPNELLGYKFLIRIYFFNNIINPIIYAWLDKRFRSSCRNLFVKARDAICRC